MPYIIELDDEKILTGKPDQFDGKNPWVSGSDFPLNQSSDHPLVISPHLSTGDDQAGGCGLAPGGARECQHRGSPQRVIPGNHWEISLY